MTLVENNVTYEKLMFLSKSHLALLVLSHRQSLMAIHNAKITHVDTIPETKEVMLMCAMKYVRLYNR